MQLLLALMALASGLPVAHAVGTAAGTVIESAASVDFVLDGAAQSVTSNTVSFRVTERIDVVVTLQSAPAIREYEQRWREQSPWLFDVIS